MATMNQEDNVIFQLSSIVEGLASQLGAVVALVESKEVRRTSRAQAGAALAFVKELQDIAYMPVPRCDGCAHWRPNEDRSRGACGRANAEDTKMWAELYDAVLTEPDFGCVQWKAKENGSK